MFAKSRKEKFVEQAQDLARDVSEAIAPHVDRARDELAPLLADARGQLADARDQVAPRIADARDQIGPKLAEARDDLAPRIAEARDQIAPHVEDARGRLAKGVATATAAATPVAVEARRRGTAAAAALKGEPVVVKKKGRKRKLFVFATLAGLGALAVQKLRGGESANWQTSYSPSPAPAAPPAPPSPAAPMAGSHTADVPVDSASGDPVGASPGESISDAAEEPHPVTTPDAPAEDVDVADIEDPKKS